LCRKRFLFVTVLHILLYSSLILGVEADSTMWTQTYGGTSFDGGFPEVVQTGDGGYAIIGDTNSYGAGNADVWLVKTDANGVVQWTQTYGGTGYDFGESIVQTDDGGYAITGSTSSYGAGNWDFWLVKTDANGNAEWNQTYGETLREIATKVVQTGDGGYVISGQTNSFGAGSDDVWLVKTDANGNAEWNQTYGGVNYDYGAYVVETNDGGYAIIGTTESFGAGSDDVWLVKTDANGNAEWNQTYGGTSMDYGSSVVQTGDGGYAIAGDTYSYGAGNIDFWLVKTDANGNAEWNQTYGGTSMDDGAFMVQTGDGGYAIAGETFSYDIRFGDVWLVKTDANGNAEWNQTYGGTEMDRGMSVVETIDGGYVIAGTTESFGAGDSDFFVIKTDEYGVAPEGPSPTPTPSPTTTPSPSPTSSGMWSKIYEDHFNDRVDYLIQTSDGGYAIAGNHYISGEEKADFWLIKTDSSGNIEWDKRYNRTDEHFGIGGLVQTSDGGYTIASRIVDNSQNRLASLIKIDDSGDIVWEKAIGSGPSDIANALIATSDGGFALAGQTLGAGNSLDFWLVKTDADGNLEWNHNYGGINNEVAYSLVERSDGGFALAGYTSNLLDYDSWLLKTDSSGNWLWNQTYGTEDLEVTHALVETSDGGFAFAGVNFTFTSLDFDYWLIKISDDGTVEWKNRYEGTIQSYVDHVGLVTTSDGGLALAGTKGSSPEGFDTFLLKTDISGNFQWNQTNSLPDEYLDCGCLVSTADGGFAIAGQTLYFDIFLIKTDEYGVVPEAAWVVLPLLVIAALSIFIGKKKLFHKQ
jgi:hypothetical protein